MKPTLAVKAIQHAKNNLKYEETKTYRGNP